MNGTTIALVTTPPWLRLRSSPEADARDARNDAQETAVSLRTMNEALRGQFAVLEVACVEATNEALRAAEAAAADARATAETSAVAAAVTLERDAFAEERARLVASHRAELGVLREENNLHVLEQRATQPPRPPRRPRAVKREVGKAAPTASKEAAAIVAEIADPPRRSSGNNAREGIGNQGWGWRADDGSNGTDDDGVLDFDLTFAGDGGFSPPNPRKLSGSAAAARPQGGASPTAQNAEEDDHPTSSGQSQRPFFGDFFWRGGASDTGKKFH